MEQNIPQIFSVIPSNLFPFIKGRDALKEWALAHLSQSSSFHFRYSNSSFLNICEVNLEMNTTGNKVSRSFFFFLSRMLSAEVCAPSLIYQALVHLNEPHGAWTSSRFFLISEPIFLPACHSLTQRMPNLSHLSC